MGLYNVFRRFMPNFAHVDAQLSKKPCKGQTQEFDELTDEEIIAFETLEARFVEPSVLPFPRSQGACTVD